MEETLIKRVLPHSIEAEQSVIGSMLMDREAVIAASEIITGSDFYQQQYGIMFDAMVELFNEGKPVDLVTLQDRLKEKDVPPEVSSLDFVRDIITIVPTSANVKSYATIVSEKAVLRRLIKTTEEIANTCYAGKEPLENILADTEKSIFDLLQNKGGQEFVPIKQVAINVLEKIEDAYRNQGTVTGIPSGFIDLDYKLSGFQPSDFILIAARPSMGKTAFVLNVVDYVSVRKNLPCMVFSLEMSKEQLGQRLLSMESKVSMQNLKTGRLERRDWDDINIALDVLSKANIHIDDTAGINIMEMKSKCRRLKGEEGLDLVVIDYLQLMTPEGRADSRTQEISVISRNLKLLARELDCPVLVLSQLSRAPETRTDHRPMLSDLRESGSIEQDADIVIFLYRDEYYNEDTESPGECEVIVAKQRSGPTGTVKVTWLDKLTKFVDGMGGGNIPEF